MDPNPCCILYRQQLILKRLGLDMSVDVTEDFRSDSELGLCMALIEPNIITNKRLTRSESCRYDRIISIS